MRTSVASILLAILLSTCSPQPTALEHVLASGRLDVVTRNSPSSYYLGVADEPTGPEYDLLRGFAKDLGVTLNVRVVDSVDDLLPAVNSGEAHLAAAGLSITEKRRKQVNFSEPYSQVTQHLIYRLGTGKPNELVDIIDKNIVVLAGSSHAETLQDLKIDIPRLTWDEQRNAEVADLLNDVANGTIDYTIADSSDFSINRNFLPDLRIAFDLELADSVAWAFPREQADSLVERANRYLIKSRRDGSLARILDRYYGHTDDFDYVGTRSFIRHVDSRLPRYREWFEQAAAENNLDWRLLAAVGYQESHWRAKAVSPTGVRGMMMLTEATADYLGIDDREDPESSIFGAARFLARLKERLPNTIREPDLTWMALASYNVGFYHVRDARAIVELNGGNPNIWMEVRQALPLLAQKKWYQRVKYGYARGWEPVQYVENIRSYLDILRWLSNDEVDEDDEELVTEPAPNEPEITASL